jgi:hypothetical protein
MFANNETQDKDEDPGFVPPWMLAAGLGAGLASLPYSRGGNRLITAPMLGPRSDRQRMLGDLIQNYAPAALRGLVLRKDSEMGAPMPTEFDYNELTSPELRSLMDQAAANTDAMAPLEGPVGGFEADQGGAPVMIGGRAVVFDETTGKYYDAETGDEMAGYKRGGPVSGSSWQERQRAQQERIASGRRAQERQMAQARDTRAPRVTATPQRVVPRQRKASELDNLVMAASRRGNDLAAGVADLMDSYGLTPADAVAWAAENIEGRSPEEVAMIRRNLSALNSNRAMIEAGAAANEQGFAAAGGRGARTGYDVAPPVRMADITYRPQDIPTAVMSEAPRALGAARDYLARSTPSSLMRDAGQSIMSGAQAFADDPYGTAFEGAMYAALPVVAGTSDFAAMRGGARELRDVARDPYVDEATRRELRASQKGLDALSVLPLLGAGGSRKAVRRRRGGRAANKE